MDRLNIFNTKKFHESISNELQASKNRVRDLIGSKHWGEEGRYKETLLKTVIKRYLPSDRSIGTGFVLTKDGITSQIDLIIYDNTYPLLFSEGDFIISTAESVKAIIEVKTNIQNAGLKETFDRLNKDTDMIFESQEAESAPFSGIFSYEGFNNNERFIEKFEESIGENELLQGYKDNGFCIGRFIDHIAINENLFCKLMYHEGAFNYSVYNIEKLSASFFISNLLEAISENKMVTKIDQNVWYPLNKEKERLRKLNI